MSNEQRVPLSTRIPSDLKRRVDLAVALQGVGYQEIVEAALEQYMERLSRELDSPAAPMLARVEVSPEVQPEGARKRLSLRNRRPA